MKKLDKKQKRATQPKAMAAALVAAGVQNIGIPTTVQGGATYAFNEFIKDKSVSILTNPMQYIDELVKYDPYWGDIALRNLCKAIGYSAVNTVLWDYRKRNKAPEVTSTIDWLNDSVAEAKAKEDSKTSLKDKGLETLEYLDGNTVIGPYKWLFDQIPKDNGSKMELPTPPVLFASMRTKDKEPVLSEYDSFEMEHLKASANFEYIKAKIEDDKKKAEVRVGLKAQDELNHIHRVLASVRSEKFDDDVWARIPLYVQFRLAKYVHNQVNSAITATMKEPADERLYLRELNAMAETILLELQAADREPEVKLAFKRGALKVESHGLIGSLNITTAMQ